MSVEATKGKRQLDWRVSDWVLVASQLDWLHRHTKGETHDALHELCDMLGAPKDWSYRETDGGSCGPGCPSSI